MCEERPLPLSPLHRMLAVPALSTASRLTPSELEYLHILRRGAREVFLVPLLFEPVTGSSSGNPIAVGSYEIARTSEQVKSRNSVSVEEA